MEEGKEGSLRFVGLPLEVWAGLTEEVPTPPLPPLRWHRLEPSSVLLEEEPSRLHVSDEDRIQGNLPACLRVVSGCRQHPLGPLHDTTAGLRIGRLPAGRLRQEALKLILGRSGGEREFLAQVDEESRILDVSDKSPE